MVRESKDKKVFGFLGRPVGFVVKIVSYVGIVLVAGCIAAIFMWQVAMDVLGFGKDDTVVSVTVPSGYTIEQVADVLYEADLITYRSMFQLFAGYSKADKKIVAGTYELKSGYDYLALVSGMSARSRARVEITVPLPEGFTLAQMFARFEENGVCDADELWEAATNYDFEYDFLDSETLGDRLRLEGFLFPDTYNFYLGSTPTQVLSKLLSEFDKKYVDEYKDRATALGLSTHEVVIMASLIEREAGADGERSRIAAVIWNRLNSPSTFPFLQIDAAIFYAIQGTEDSFSVELDSPYNTYMYGGLPPTPIANPGIASIYAVLYPATTDEYYYALNKQGTHNFFKTYEQHKAFLASDDYVKN